MLVNVNSSKIKFFVAGLQVPGRKWICSFIIVRVHGLYFLIYKNQAIRFLTRDLEKFIISIYLLDMFLWVKEKYCLAQALLKSVTNL